jgi:hypothetical protein
MRDEYTDKHGNLNRYFTRWMTEHSVGIGGFGLNVIAWEVCDRRKFDNIGMGKYETKDKADAMCKLLNSIEEENDGLSK